MAFDTASYDLLKKSKQQEALNKKNNTVSALETQKGNVENTYLDLTNTLARRKAELQTKNVADNQNLDTQLKTGQEGYMQQRDQGVIANTNQNKALMDWYAKNNIANSTASADEMGRQATTLNNTLGSINSNKNNFETTLGNNRNLTNMDYQSGVNDLVNQDNSAQREKAQKLAEILNQIMGAESSYNSEVQSGNDSIEAQRLQDLNAYNERLRQEQVQAQQAAEERAFQERQNALNRAPRPSAPKDPQIELDKQKDKEEASLYKIMDSIDGRYLYDSKNEYGDSQGKKVSDPQGLRNYILGLNLDDNKTDQLFLRYGLAIPQAPRAPQPQPSNADIFRMLRGQ